LSEEAATVVVMGATEVLERLTTIARADNENPGITLRALELLGKHHVLFAEKHIVQHTDIAARLAAASERIGDSADSRERRRRDPPRAKAAGKGSRARSATTRPRSKREDIELGKLRATLCRNDTRSVN
jgi:hypothetical protein